jgi:sterol desaturase/sphingolipid hydroxylase (fatty acid hydroxylase superfamily)
MGALLQHAGEVSALVFFGALIAASLLEWAVPRRPISDTVRLRWLSNFGISILNVFILRSVFPVLSVGWAFYCASRGWGLFHRVDWPAWLTVPLGIAWLDVLFYAQHVAMHRVPLLWRAHRTHHTDHDCDFSTGLRAHPTETLLTNGVTFAGILVSGASPLAVFLGQLLATAFAFLGHSNVRLPLALDRALRLVMVTPDMHRVHHSVDVKEGDSNFSTLFPWWDRLFGTYQDQPAAGHARMAFGVRGFEARKHLSLPWMLAQPFLRPKQPASGDTSGAPAVPMNVADPKS